MSVTGGPLATAGRWTVDPHHSYVEFEAKHLGITRVKGRFRDFEGTLGLDGVGGIRAHGVVRVDSLDTGSPERDAHLLSADFFDADRHPEIRYRLLEFREDGAGRALALGELTIRSVTRQPLLEASFTDAVRDPWGNDRLALDLSGELRRRDFGLTWNGLLDGRPIVGDSVCLTLNLSLVRRATPVRALERQRAA